MDERKPVDGPGGPSRRRVLSVVAVGGGGLLLAACGGGSPAPSSAGGSAGPDQVRSPTSGPGAELVAAADVPVRGGVVLDARQVVVTQPEPGTFKAFSAVCTHQGCIVSGVQDDVIVCPCHGSTFSAADGSVRNGPATQPLPQVPVSLRGDRVVQA